MSGATAIPINMSFSDRIAALEPSQRMRVAFGIVLFVVIGVGGLILGRQAEWRILYSNLADKDGGAIISQLSQMGIPYKHTEGGGAILVPADKVHDARLKLASLGLPKGGIAGFESMESNRFGMTQFQERLTFQRGLEGELTRSIQSLSSVQSARVHLALPIQNCFVREQQQPSASVLVSLHPSRSLDSAQLAGIVHLVAASVPELTPSAVSVLDDTGKLLSTPADGAGALSGADSQQMQYVQQIEQSYSQRIVDILGSVVGRQNVKAQVTAELDFSQTESTVESHKPNKSPDSSAIRSQQVVESGAGGNANPSGVPGATSNQPPGPASAPIGGSAQALSAAGGASTSVASSGKRESITNYEVDKTVRVVRGATGAIKRISAAVVLNNQSVTDEKGKTTSTPYTDQQIEKMTALVRETIGFSQARGDSVNLMNAPFTVEKQVVVELPFWRQPEVVDIARSFAWPMGTLLFGALVLLGLVRPTIKAMAQPQLTAQTAGAQLDAVVADDTDRPQLTAPKELLPEVASVGDMRLEDARKLTRDNPAAVANIVKAWINGEVPA